MKVLFSFAFMLFSVTAFALNTSYLCTSTGNLEGSPITSATVTFRPGLGGTIKGANLVVQSEQGKILKSAFRGMRVSKQTGSVMLDGKKNGRISPFGDVNYLQFPDLRKEISFDELTDSLRLNYSSLSGPVGNRGGESFDLNCSISLRLISI